LFTAWDFGEDGVKMEQTVYEDVRTAIERFHEKNFIVFGDLRSLNIMIKVNKRTVLIDFDWAAKERYNPMISNDVKWALGVESYAEDLHGQLLGKRACFSNQGQVVVPLYNIPLWCSG
jgi:tRNA A-37 threonylcarbamoyl transferase component Bud32